MKKLKHNKFWKIILTLTIGFFSLFIFKVIYNQYNNVAPPHINNQVIFKETILDLESRRNYASIKYEIPNQSSSSNLNQKYEKIAKIIATSHQFNKEEKEIRKHIQGLNGLIQFENKNGNEGYRRLELIIGVPPKNFDPLFQNLIKIGKVQQKEITKKDKTNEYKELNAKKLSLEKIRTSLVNLKSKSGKINEYMLLENRILEIEQQLQELGVSLGSFDDENEFCTIKFTINESPIIQVGLLEHMKNALEWTIEFYLKLMATCAFMALLAFLAIHIIEKMKIKE